MRRQAMTATASTTVPSEPTSHKALLVGILRACAYLAIAGALMGYLTGGRFPTYMLEAGILVPIVIFAIPKEWRHGELLAAIIYLPFTSAAIYLAITSGVFGFILFAVSMLTINIFGLIWTRLETPTQGGACHA